MASHGLLFSLSTSWQMTIFLQITYLNSSNKQVQSVLHLKRDRCTWKINAGPKSPYYNFELIFRNGYGEKSKGKWNTMRKFDSCFHAYIQATLCGRRINIKFTQKLPESALSRVKKMLFWYFSESSKCGVCFVAVVCR